MDLMATYESETDTAECEKDIERNKENRKESEIKRNTGQEYISASGKTVAKRVLTRLSYCKKECFLKVNLKDQKRIFSSYWKQGNYESRSTFISTCIELGQKKRCKKEKPILLRKFCAKYFLYTDSGRHEVCKKCLRLTLGETDSFIRSVLDKMWNSLNTVPGKDGRGSHVPSNKTSPEKIQEVEDHIKKYPAYESHYSRAHTSKKYLGDRLSIPIMYDMYKKEVSQPVSIKIYREIFKKTGLKFKVPSLDTCHKCDSFAAQLKVLTDDDEKRNVLKLQEMHHIESQDAYKSKNKDKIYAEQDTSKSKVVCTFDLQQCLPTPLVQTSVMFYKRCLWTFNLTISNSTLKHTVCHMWHEGVGNRGANEIASCLYNYLQNLPSHVKHIVLYSDSCGGQNKNKILLAMFSSFVAQHSTLEVLDHKFLVPRHTHMECDVDHALIEKAKRNLNHKIERPEDWYELVRNLRCKKPFSVTVMSKENLYNFGKLLKGPLVMRRVNVKKEPFRFPDAKWFRYTKSQGLVFYKTSLSEDEEFKQLSLNRRGTSSFNLDSKLELAYEGDLPISKEKTTDLLSILHLLGPSGRIFYENLLEEKNACSSNFDPDIIRTLDIDLVEESIEDENDDENFNPTDEKMENEVDSGSKKRCPRKRNASASLRNVGKSSPKRNCLRKRKEKAPAANVKPNSRKQTK